MPFKTPEYPDILTQANWDKKKGVFAKIFGEKTGIGEAMKALKKAYDDVDWEKFKLANHLPQGKEATLEVLDKLKKEAIGQGAKIKALDEKARALERLAEEIHKKFKENKKIPAASTEHVKKVYDAAKLFDYAITMGTITDLLEKEYQENKQGIETSMKVHGENRKRLASYIDKVIAGVEKTYTKDQFNAFWSECIRGLGTALPQVVANQPELKGEYTVWKQFSADPFQATDQDTPETLKQKCQQVKVVVQKIKQKVEAAGG
jgi:hypothetical protein